MPTPGLKEETTIFNKLGMLEWLLGIRRRRKGGILAIGIRLSKSMVACSRKEEQARLGDLSLQAAPELKGFRSISAHLVGKTDRQRERERERGRERDRETEGERE